MTIERDFGKGQKDTAQNQAPEASGKDAGLSKEVELKPGMEAHIQEAGESYQAGTDAISSGFEKSPVMHKIEERLGRPIEEIITDLRDRQGMSFSEMAEILDVHTATVSAWVYELRHGIKKTRIRPQEEKAGRDRSTAAKASWADPQMKADRLAVIHSPKAEGKRSEALLDYYARNPQAKGADAKKRMHAHMKEKLGENPAETLRKMSDQYGISLEEIANRIDVNYRTLLRWNNDLGVPIKRGSKGSARPSVSWRGNLLVIREAIALGIFDNLNPNQQNILRRRYTHKGGKPLYRLEDLAQERAVNRQAIKQSEAIAIKKLRRLIEQAQTEEETGERMQNEEVDAQLLEELGILSQDDQIKLKEDAVSLAYQLQEALRPQK